MGPARQGVVTRFLSGKTPAPLRTRGADEAHCSRTRTVGTNARASLQARPPAPRCSGVPKCDRLSLARLRAMRPRSGERVSATGRCARCAGILTRLSVKIGDHRPAQAGVNQCLSLTSLKLARQVEHWALL